MNNDPHTKSTKAKDIKIGDVIAFCLFEVWHFHKVSSLDMNSLGWHIIRANNDTASFIYQPDERMGVVQA